METKYQIPNTYTPLLIEGIPDIYYISIEHRNVWNSETNHYIIPDEKNGGRVNFRKLEGGQRHIIFRNLIETRIPEGFVLCNGIHSRNDRKHYINKFGEVFINSKQKTGNNSTNTYRWIQHNRIY